MAAQEPLRLRAPPVRSGSFSYDPSQGFRVVLEGHPYHPVARASSEEIYGNLTYTPPTGPALTKTGKIRVHQPAPHTDPTVWYYQGQLIHYGLKPLKSKDAAKKALLKAFQEAQGAELKVPQAILDEEEVMKVKYHQANIVANEKREKEKEVERKAAHAAYLAKELELAAAEKRRLAWVERSAKEASAKRSFDGSQASGSGVGKKSKLSKVFDKTLLSVQDEYTLMEHGLGNPSRFMLTLAFSSTKKHIWGCFNFGEIKGYMRSKGPLPPPSSFMAGRTIEFLWRGRESGEGMSHFDSDNIIPITFNHLTNEGWKEGWNFTGEITFMGKHRFAGYGEGSGGVAGRGGSGNATREVQSWKAGYYKLTRANYEREDEARWGGSSSWGRYYDSDDESREDNSDSD